MSQAPTLEVRSAYRGRVIAVSVETVALPNGRRVELEIVRHPGAAVVVPLADDGTTLMVRQYRHAASGYLLEAPAGKLEAGESPESCARREVEEEVGVRVQEMVPLGFVYASPGFTDERLWLFLGRGLTPVSQALEPDEVLTVERLPLVEAVRRAQAGELSDAKTVCALLRARAHLGW